MQTEERPQLCVLQIYKNGQQFYIREKLSAATLQGILVSNGRRTYKTNKIMLMVYRKKEPSQHWWRCILGQPSGKRAAKWKQSYRMKFSLSLRETPGSCVHFTAFSWYSKLSAIRQTEKDNAIMIYIYYLIYIRSEMLVSL